MPVDRLTTSANISMLFAELPYRDRPAAARRQGFADIESWWPFATATGTSDQVVELLRTFDDAGTALTGLNFFAGDMPGGERGIACRPDRQDELRRNVEQVVEIGSKTGCKAFNLLYGQLDERWPEDLQRETAARAIREAAAAVAEIDGVVLIEPLAAGLNGRYPWQTGDDVVEFLRRDLADLDNVKLLFDVFHLGTNGVDLVSAAERLISSVGHVQLADSPGRGEPGSGRLPIQEALEALVRSGYRGLVAGEYNPTTATELTLSWRGWDVFVSTSEVQAPGPAFGQQAR